MNRIWMRVPVENVEPGHLLNPEGTYVGSVDLDHAGRYVLDLHHQDATVACTLTMEPGSQITYVIGVNQ